MMTFENPVWMENDFPVGIFEIFHFQKHAPIWDMCRVKKIFKKMNFYIENLSDILLCLNYSLLADPRPFIFIFVWKMMNFANHARVENQYGIKIFGFFTSENIPPLL